MDPSPQRTPLLFQAGTSAAGSEFAATHAEAVFVSAHSPSVLAPKIAHIRALAGARGRDPRSVKFFATFTPILGRTDAEARAKHAALVRDASVVGGLVLVSGWTGIDLSQLPLDHEITAADSHEVHKVTSILDSFTAGAEAGWTGEDDDDEGKKKKTKTPWTPRLIAERAAIGGLGPTAVGSPETVADELERWVAEADVDGFNIGYVTTPGSFADVVDLLVPELRRRGLYAEAPVPPGEGQGLTARERIYGAGQRGLRDDHPGSAYKYAVYREEDAETGASARAVSEARVE